MAGKKKSKNYETKSPQERLAEFVGTMTKRMTELLKNPGEWEKGWIGGGLAWPSCALTGHEYQGANVFFLMLANWAKGYRDNRWLTYKQALEYGEKYEIEDCHVEEGEKGTTLMRPERCWMLVEKDGKVKYLSAKTGERIIEDNGGERPDNLKPFTSYRAFTVFNVEQVRNFPKMEDQPGYFNAENERDAFIDNLVACSGVPVHYEEVTAPHYSPTEDLIRMFPVERFKSSAEFAGTKLHEFFHSTGHEKRENRIDMTRKEYPLEEMRAELFSFFAAGYLGIPISEENAAAYISHWNKEFTGDEVKNVLAASKDAAKILNLVREFKNGGEITLKWFPKKEDWDSLRAAQRERDNAKPKEARASQLLIMGKEAPKQLRLF